MKMRIKLMVIVALFCFIDSNAQTGIFTITGNLNKQPGPATIIQLKNTSGPGTGHDQIVVNGNVTMDGPLYVELDGYSPNSSDQFEIISYTGTFSGAFSFVNWPSGMTGWMIDYGVLNTGKVTIYGPSSPLPVEWLSFGGTMVEKGNLLSWSTASEVNSDYFAVEYSKDGTSFSTAGQIRAAGQSNAVQKYEYMHDYKADGLVYYRVKQVDVDGKYSYSSIISLNRKGNNDNTVIIYPNPSDGLIHFNKEVNLIEIFDAKGSKILSRNNVGKTMDASMLPDGKYNILIDHIISSSFIIQK
ncbi:MAG: hypothetical protein RLZZ546_777 [Bacteroidota bacterium]